MEIAARGVEKHHREVVDLGTHHGACDVLGDGLQHAGVEVVEAAHPRADHQVGADVVTHGREDEHLAYPSEKHASLHDVGQRAVHARVDRPGGLRELFHALEQAEHDGP